MRKIKNYKDFIVESKKELYDIIPKSIIELKDIFKSANFKLYLVGGSVRDFINGEKPKDFDLCTDAKPEEIISLLKDKYKVTLQGEAFGVVVVYTEDQPMGMEIATFRTDQYGDKLGTTRNPEIKFATIEEDVLRRDITYNSLFYDLDKKEIVDLVNGLKDIEDKITRFVGDPNLRIKEDPLRILRVIRFSTRYNFPIVEDNKKAIKDNAHLLSIITKERIWDEIKKGYKQSKSFVSYLELYNELGLWKPIFELSNINEDIIQMSKLELYLSNLFINEDYKKVYDKIVLKYKIDGDVAKIVHVLLWLESTKNMTGDTLISELITIHKRIIATNVDLKIIEEWFIKKGYSDVYFKLLRYVNRVNSQELMSMGYKGKALGDKIKELEINNFKELI